MSTRGLAGESTEMYLKSLCELGGDVTLVPIAALAQRLEISPISATERIHRLELEGLVEHAPYRGVQLTRRGARQARRILRRHRLWERFLVDHLGMAWDNVHDLACQLEHAVGDPVTERLAAFLGEPATCPHGNPVPSALGEAALPPGVPLSDFQAGSRGQVLRIQAESRALLASVQALGLYPGTPFTKHTPTNSAPEILIDLANGTTSVPHPVAEHVIVEAGG